jgi:hypothetical protein
MVEREPWGQKIIRVTPETWHGDERGQGGWESWSDSRNRVQVGPAGFHGDRERKRRV